MKSRVIRESPTDRAAGSHEECNLGRSTVCIGREASNTPQSVCDTCDDVAGRIIGQSSGLLFRQSKRFRNACGTSVGVELYALDDPPFVGEGHLGNVVVTVKGVSEACCGAVGVLL